MNTCIAYLTEIRKFCSKNLVHKGVNFEAQNALKLTYMYEHVWIFPTLKSATWPLIRNWVDFVGFKH